MWFKNLLPPFIHAHTYTHACVHTNRRNILKGLPSLSPPQVTTAVQCVCLFRMHTQILSFIFLYRVTYYTYYTCFFHLMWYFRNLSMSIHRKLYHIINYVNFLLLLSILIFISLSRFLCVIFSLFVYFIKFSNGEVYKL